MPGLAGAVAAAQLAAAARAVPQAVIRAGRCAEHDTRWEGDRPCFLCSPEAWEVDPPKPMSGSGVPPDPGADVESLVREILTARQQDCPTLPG